LFLATNGLCVLLVCVERVERVCVVFVVCVVLDDLFLDSLIGLNSLPPVEQLNK
jgi:hypothetical protein